MELLGLKPPVINVLTLNSRSSLNWASDQGRYWESTGICVMERAQRIDVHSKSLEFTQEQFRVHLCSGIRICWILQNVNKLACARLFEEMRPYFEECSWISEAAPMANRKCRTCSGPIWSAVLMIFVSSFRTNRFKGWRVAQALARALTAALWIY